MCNAIGVQDPIAIFWYDATDESELLAQVGVRASLIDRLIDRCIGCLVSRRGPMRLCTSGVVGLSA